jgi:hypothetical protein
MTDLQGQTEALLKALHSINGTLDDVHLLLMITVVILFGLLLVAALACRKR